MRAPSPAKMVVLVGWTSVALFGCDLFNTLDSENAVGRGPKAFDPYAAAASGAIRLDLVSFNGCEIRPNGNAVSPGVAQIPYPAQCATLNAPDPNAAMAPPTAVRPLLVGTQYFLNQLTLMDSEVWFPGDSISNPIPDSASALAWMTTSSRFASLDWSNVGVNLDEWTPFNGDWIREVSFGQAAWMQDTADSFLVEVLDSSGTPRQQITYSHEDFLGESAIAGHSRVSWRLESVGPPLTPTDVTPEPAADGSLQTFRATVRIDLVGSTNPFKQFDLSDLSGDGAIRVTWSSMPNAPFYFPVTFVNSASIAAGCYSTGTLGPVQCGFGLTPEANFSTPQNGQYYTENETFDAFMQFEDDNNNLLNPPNLLPSYDDFYADNANGLLYYNPGTFNALLEFDSESGFQVVGPLQAMTPQRDPNQAPAFFQYTPNHSNDFAPPIAQQGIVPGISATHWPTRYPITIPQGALPGTYALLVKANREFLGERTSKLNVFPFQVGQSNVTTYPGRVGNCQICHRGVLSLDNLRHGMSVDNIEACKACHANSMSVEIHQIHIRSNKFPVVKNDCTTCHLTRESATRPSFDVCSSCHPAVHGVDYFQLQFAVASSPNRYGECAQSCHVNSPPTNHVLPPN